MGDLDRTRDDASRNRPGDAARRRAPGDFPLESFFVAAASLDRARALRRPSLEVALSGGPLLRLREVLVDLLDPSRGPLDLERSLRAELVVDPLFEKLSRSLDLDLLDLDPELDLDR